MPASPGRPSPNYPVPYGATTVAAITEVLNRIRDYLDTDTPARIINKQTGAEVTDFTKPDTNSILQAGAFPIISYEWGVTYSGMLLAAQTTGDSRFQEYVAKRMRLIVQAAPYFRALSETGWPLENDQFRSVIHPNALDDSGSMCAAMIKAQRAGLIEARPLIDHFADYVSTKQFRLADGTLARKRPLADSLWLDDLYMSVPALAQMGKLTGDRKYYNDAVRQVTQFSDRMFNRQLNLYMHGWIAGMSVHPEFHWARANGWALMAMTDLLDVLPEASAIFTYCLAHGINRGWIDPLAYGPMVQLAWNAVATKVNAQGQVEDTCVGTNMGFDPAFYYCRPRSVFAAHGYGSVLLAGAEMIVLTKSDRVVINGGAVQFGKQPADMKAAN